MDPDCVFCRIVAGTAPASVVHADDTAVAFLDVAPVTPGHMLVVPRTHAAGLNGCGGKASRSDCPLLRSDASDRPSAALRDEAGPTGAASEGRDRARRPAKEPREVKAWKPGSERPQGDDSRREHCEAREQEEAQRGQECGPDETDAGHDGGPAGANLSRLVLIPGRFFDRHVCTPR